MTPAKLLVLVIISLSYITYFHSQVGGRSRTVRGQLLLSRVVSIVPTQLRVLRPFLIILVSVYFTMPRFRFPSLRPNSVTMLAGHSGIHTFPPRQVLVFRLCVQTHLRSFLIIPGSIHFTMRSFGILSSKRPKQNSMSRKTSQVFHSSIALDDGASLARLVGTRRTLLG